MGKTLREFDFSAVSDVRGGRTHEQFNNCTGLVSINFSCSGDWLFFDNLSDCVNLETITVHPNNPYFTIVNGVSFNKDKTYLDTFPRGKKGHYTIPDWVNEIRWHAFHGCKVLTSITIPNSVKKIGESAFAGCSILSSVTFPDSLTTIEGRAFERCFSLKSINISKSVINIDEAPFLACAALLSITVHPDNPSFTSVNGVLFNRDMTELIRYPAGRHGDFPVDLYYIPDTIVKP